MASRMLAGSCSARGVGYDLGRVYDRVSPPWSEMQSGIVRYSIALMSPFYRWTGLGAAPSYSSIMPRRSRTGLEVWSRASMRTSHPCIEGGSFTDHRQKTAAVLSTRPRYRPGRGGWSGRRGQCRLPALSGLGAVVGAVQLLYAVVYVAAQRHVRCVGSGTAAVGGRLGLFGFGRVFVLWHVCVPGPLVQ